MSPLEPDNEFWRFSLKVYGAPGVQDECIALQSAHDLDINVLLLGAWLGAHRGVALDAATLKQLQDRVRSWNVGVVQPLRIPRKAIKALPGSGEPAVRALTSAVARDEIEAERIEQAMLHAVWSDVGLPGVLPAKQHRELIATNVAHVIASYGAAHESSAPSASALIAAALENAIERRV